MKNRVFAMLSSLTLLTAAAAFAQSGAVQQKPVKMTFSGSIVSTTLEIQPNTFNHEEHLAGNGTLGPFTFRNLWADDPSSQSQGSCGSGSGPNYRVVRGGGVFRFHDGSLLAVGITGGTLCVDLVAQPPVGHLTETYQITGGTGRFKGATGTLALKATLGAVLFDTSGMAKFLMSTGELEGTVVRAAVEEERQGEQQ